MQGDKSLKQAKQNQLYQLQHLVELKVKNLGAKIQSLLEEDKKLKQQHQNQQQSLGDEFKKLREFLDTYQQQYEQLMMDQYTIHITKIHSTVENYRVQISRLDEIKIQTINYLKRFRTWQYNKVLVESCQIDENVNKDLKEIKELLESNLKSNYQFGREVLIDKFKIDSNFVIGQILSHFQNASNRSLQPNKNQELHDSKQYWELLSNSIISQDEDDYKNSNF
ncbi:UNKNOWN [Stylonychia lemnae]|uniref:Uncharacterized protein n=1 Tax=Stylonychia lemnae TaxID=5949 RepID=A0A078B6P5_STYLE|nr:UNKNOWN [Stylonychia lemnae]|eukprot:CDW89238.1 UNKNOWN [Stylonychia lemnae]